jgi:proline iminopeptidase
MGGSAVMTKTLLCAFTLVLGVGVHSLAAQAPTEPPGAFVTVNGHKLWYRSSGHGQPLVLIAGGPGSSHSYFYPALERLTDSFRVIYFDAYGRGRSDRASDPHDYSFARDVDEVEGLRMALGLNRIAVYGHSYGGIVAQAYALKYPRSLSHLILANTFHSAEMWQKGNNDNWNHELQNQFPDLWDELQHLRAAGGVSCDSAYQAIEGRMPASLVYFYDPSNVGGASYASFDINLQVYCQIAGPDADVVLGGDLSSIDFRRRLRTIEVPTLVLAGRFDRVAIPRYTMQFKTLMPRAQFVLFEKSGHEPFIEEPERHDSTVRAFLRR